jgi:hypothetical protein
MDGIKRCRKFVAIQQYTNKSIANFRETIPLKLYGKWSQAEDQHYYSLRTHEENLILQHCT